MARGTFTNPKWYPTLDLAMPGACMSCDAGDVECANETVCVPGIGFQESGEIYQMASESYDWTGTFHLKINDFFQEPA